MKEIEDLLKDAPLPEPPDNLHRRVAAAVDEAERRLEDRRPAVVPLWAFAAGCLACTLVGFLIHPLVERPQPPPAEGASVVYIIEPNRPDLRILGTKPAPDRRSFWEKERTEWKHLVRGD